MQTNDIQKDQPSSAPGTAEVKVRARDRRGTFFYFTAIMSVVFASCFIVFAIWPRYKNPLNRLYSSTLGYPTAARKFNLPFPVEIATVGKRKLTSAYQGEGTLSSEPNLVPIVPVGRIVRMHVNVGDTVKKGQLLAEIDSRFQLLKVSEAETAVLSAQSERERVLTVSNRLLMFERPEVEKIRQQAATGVVQIYDELLAMDRSLIDRSSLSRRDMLNDKIQQTTIEGQRKEAEFNMRMADKGLKESLKIADNNLTLARHELKYRLLELEDFKVVATCDGIIERCFVHEGEYNQELGKPAFLIDESQWFEARMDQTTIGKFAVGDHAEIYLQAFPEQPLPGKIERIVGVVNYDAGGPKATRPVRPLGSGAPEWPSTYAVRIKLEPTKLPVAPGLTGFARIAPEKEVVSVPSAALFARSGRTGSVYVVNDDHSYSPRKVAFGATGEGFVEITAGLEPGMRVLSDGFQFLKPEDEIEVSKQDGKTIEHAVLKYSKADSAQSTK